MWQYFENTRRHKWCFTRNGKYGFSHLEYSGSVSVLLIKNTILLLVCSHICYHVYKSSVMMQCNNQMSLVCVLSLFFSPSCFFFVFIFSWTDVVLHSPGPNLHLTSGIFLWDCCCHVQAQSEHPCLEIRVGRNPSRCGRPGPGVGFWNGRVELRALGGENTNAAHLSALRTRRT